MSKIGWKRREDIEAEKQAREQKRQEKQARRQRIRDGVKSAKSMQELRAVVADIVEELDLLSPQDKEAT